MINELNLYLKRLRRSKIINFDNTFAKNKMTKREQ